MHFHLMGIGGAGVSALARLLRQRGYDVSGCDAQNSPEIEKLIAEGFLIDIGHHPNHISTETDALVISTAIAQGHPEVSKAKTGNIPVRYRIEVLGDLLRETEASIGVIGTHGKTTTSSMIAATLLAAQLDPTALIGSSVHELSNSNMRLGSGPFVAELDESDPRFQWAVPRLAVLTNLEADHIGRPGDLRPNFSWTSFSELREAVRGFLSRTEKVVYCADWPGLASLCEQTQTAISYGMCDSADYRAHDFEMDGLGSAFTVRRGTDTLGKVKLKIPGKYNALNALAAIAVADLLNADLNKVFTALEHFRGASRRFEFKGSANGAWVVDDYAHHPTEISAVLEAAKASGRTLKVVFQPHRFLRTAQTWEASADALMSADHVYVIDIYGAGERPIEGIHARNIVQRMIENGHRSCHYTADLPGTLRALVPDLSERDLVLTIGAGDITQLGGQLIGVSQQHDRLAT